MYPVAAARKRKVNIITYQAASTAFDTLFIQDQNRLAFVQIPGEYARGAECQAGLGTALLADRLIGNADMLPVIIGRKM